MLSNGTFSSYKTISFSFQNGDDKENFKKLTDIIKESKNGRTLGILPKYEFPSCQSWNAVLTENQIENIDISAAVAYIIGPKEDSELDAIKKACSVTGNIFTKYLKAHIMEIIDADTVSLRFVHQNMLSQPSFQIFLH